MNYPVHPAAELFPMLPEKELQDIAANIRAIGLLHPIVLWNGQLIDGRNRLAACRIANVEPRTIEVEMTNGCTPTEWILATNKERRHLTQSQKAAIAVSVLPLLEADAAERRRTGRDASGTAGGRGHKKNLSPTLGEGLSHGKATEIAAEKLGVSHGTIEYAKAVKVADPELFQQVLDGKVSASTAYDKIAKTPRSKLKPIRHSPLGDPESKRAKQRLEKARVRLAEVLGTMRGMCRALNEEADIEVLRAALTAEEIKAWVNISLECARLLRTFAASLKGEQQQ